MKAFGACTHNKFNRSYRKKPRKSERAFTVSCGRNSGNTRLTGHKIWSDNRQGGGIMKDCPATHVFLPYKLKVID